MIASAMRFPAATETAHAETAPLSVSVWRSPTAWVLLGPLVYFLTGGMLLAKNNANIFLEGSASVLDGDNIPFAREYQAVAWLVTVGVMLPYTGRILRLLGRYKALAVLILLVFVSSLWADNFVESLRRGTLLNLTLLLGLYLSERFSPEEQLSLIYGVGVCAVLGSYATAVLLPSINRGFEGEWKGIFGHKNDLGMFLFFVLSPIFFMRPATLTTRIVRGVVLLLGLGLVGLSQSRGAWVVGLALFGYVLASRVVDHFERRSALLLTAVGVPCVGGLFALISANFDKIAYALGKDPHLTNRSLIWGAVWPSLMKRPIWGYGYGGFWNGLNGESANVILAVGTTVPHAHNGILNVALQIGAVGVGLAVWMTARGVRDGFVLLGRRADRHFLWCGAVLVLTIMSNIDESNLLRQNTLITALWVLALVELWKATTGARDETSLDGFPER